MKCWMQASLVKSNLSPVIFITWKNKTTCTSYKQHPMRETKRSRAVWHIRELDSARLTGDLELPSLSPWTLLTCLASAHSPLAPSPSNYLLKYHHLFNTLEKKAKNLMQQFCKPFQRAHLYAQGTEHTHTHTHAGQHKPCSRRTAFKVALM